MLHHDLEQSIGYWMTLATQAYHRALGAEVAPHGITYRQSLVLAWLAIDGELSQSELAARMMVEPPTLVGILDRMERDGWITRNSCPTDRRKKMIRPSEAAEPAWQKITECGSRVRARATAGLTEEELQTVQRILLRVYHNIEPTAPVEDMT